MSNIPGLLGPEVGYTDLLDYHLLKKQEDENSGPRERSPLRPSAAGFCARKLAYEYQEFRGKARYPAEDRDPAIIRLLNFGHSVEYHLLRMMGDVEIFDIRYKQQVLTFFPITEKEIIEGSIDFVIYSAEHKAVGDVKSKGDKYSTWSKSKWDETDEKLRNMETVKEISDTAYWIEDLPAFLDEINDPFLADNFVQLNLYATNDFMKARGINHAFLIQYNKNDSRIRELRFKPSDAVADYVKDKFQRIAAAIDNGPGPEAIEKEAFVGSIRCAFCRFKDNCWPEQDAKQEYFKTFPPKKWPKDTNRLSQEVAEELETLYAKFKEAEGVLGKQAVTEEKLCMTMKAANIDKVRFEDGAVYELKFLKSPRPHYELRRSKT